MEALAFIANATAMSLKSGHTLYLCGNGGSAAICGHIHAELVWRMKKKTLTNSRCIDLTANTAVMLAIANDSDPVKVFSQQLRGAHINDILWAFTTSGNSPNILEAMNEMNRQAGTTFVFTGDSKSSHAFNSPCKQEIVLVPSASTQVIQDVHGAIAHILCEAIEEELSQC